jgi:hypothetical protein
MSDLERYRSANGAYEVGPGTGEHKDASLRTLAKDAAALLERGEVVRWMPGDCTVYEVKIVTHGPHRWLVLLNFNAALRLRPAGMGAADYVRNGGPQGGWQGIRPLLVGLGIFSGRTDPYELHAIDVREEAEQRSHQERSQYVKNDDEALGRHVRLLVENGVKP